MCENTAAKQSAPITNCDCEAAIDSELKLKFDEWMEMKANTSYGVECEQSVTMKPSLDIMDIVVCVIGLILMAYVARKTGKLCTQE